MPEFNPKSKDGKVSRMAVLKKVFDNNPSKKAEEVEKVQEYVDLVTRYIAEDNKEVEKVISTRPPVTKLVELMNSGKSKATKMAYKISSGEKDINAEAVDAIAFRNESIMEGLGELVEQIANGDVAYTIASILKAGNMEELKIHLAKFLKKT